MPWEQQKMKIWLIGDTHFNHALMVETGLRPPHFERKIAKGITASQGMRHGRLR